MDALALALQRRKCDIVWLQPYVEKLMHNLLRDYNLYQFVVLVFCWAKKYACANMQITNGRSWIMHLRLCSASASESTDDGYSKTCTPCYVSEGHIEHGV